MRKSKEQKKLDIANVRHMMVVRPEITLSEMVDELRGIGSIRDYHYISRLRQDILKERVVRADRKILGAALSAFEDLIFDTSAQAAKIAYNPKRSPMEQLTALRLIQNAHSLLFDKLFDAGVFERQLGAVEFRIRNRPLNEEQMGERLEVARRWGLLKPAESNATSQSAN